MRVVTSVLLAMSLAAPVAAGSIAPVVDFVVEEPAPAVGSLGGTGAAIAAGLAVLALVALASGSSSSTTAPGN